MPGRESKGACRRIVAAVRSERVGCCVGGIRAANRDAQDKPAVAGGCGGIERRRCAQQNGDDALLALDDFGCRTAREGNLVGHHAVVRRNGEDEGLVWTQPVVCCAVAVAVAYYNIGAWRISVGERKRESRRLIILGCGVVGDAVGNAPRWRVGRERDLHARYGLGCRTFRIGGVNNARVIIRVRHVEDDIVVHA